MSTQHLTTTRPEPPELADLFTDRGAGRVRVLLTPRLSPRARTRYEQALWYAWGREDAGDDRTRGTRSGHYLSDAFCFAEFAALEAERYERQAAYMLENIGDQFGRFVALLEELEPIGRP